MIRISIKSIKYRNLFFSNFVQNSKLNYEEKKFENLKSTRPKETNKRRKIPLPREQGPTKSKMYHDMPEFRDRVSIVSLQSAGGKYVRRDYNPSESYCMTNE